MFSLSQNKKNSYCNPVIVKLPTTPEKCRRTTLWSWFIWSSRYVVSLAHTGSGSRAVDDVTDPASVARARDVGGMLGVVTDDDGAVLRAKHRRAGYWRQVATAVHCTHSYTLRILYRFIILPR